MLIEMSKLDKTLRELGLKTEQAIITFLYFISFLFNIKNNKIMMTLTVVFLLFGVFIVFSSIDLSSIEKDKEFERKRDEYRNAKYKSWD